MSCDSVKYWLCWTFIEREDVKNKVLRSWQWTDQPAGWISSCTRGRTWWRRPPGPGWGGWGGGWWGAPSHYWRTGRTRGASTLQSLKHTPVHQSMWKISIPKGGCKFPHFLSTFNLSIMRSSILGMIYKVSYNSGLRKLNSVWVLL